MSIGVCRSRDNGWAMAHPYGTLYEYDRAGDAGVAGFTGQRARRIVPVRAGLDSHAVSA